MIFSLRQNTIFVNLELSSLVEKRGGKSDKFGEDLEFMNKTHSTNLLNFLRSFPSRK